jgi:hypothetical protein
VDVLQDGCNGRVTSERNAPSEQLVGNNSQGIDVTAEVDLDPLGLLRAHVLGSADHLTGRGDAASRTILFRDTKVHESHHTMGITHDVGGLEVSMDDAGVVNCLQTLGQLDGHVIRFVYRGNTSFLQYFLQVDSLDKFHGNIEKPSVFAVVMDGAYVSMTNFAREFYLEPEALRHLGILSVIGTEDFYGNPLVEGAITDLVNRTHPATAQGTFDLITGVQEYAGAQLGSNGGR